MEFFAENRMPSKVVKATNKVRFKELTGILIKR